MKEQLIINRLILEMYGDYGMVTVGMKQIAALNSGGMAKLLKWIAHIHEILCGCRTTECILQVILIRIYLGISA